MEFLVCFRHKEIGTWAVETGRPIRQKGHQERKHRVGKRNAM